MLEGLVMQSIGCGRKLREGCHCIANIWTTKHIGKEHLSKNAPCQPRRQCASVDNVDAAGSECSVLIYYSHNSHSLFNYSVDLARSS